MSSKREITLETVNADIAKWTAQTKEHPYGSFNKTAMTLDWMDIYVACIHPEKMKWWAKKCAEVERITVKNKDGEPKTDKAGEPITRADVKAVVEIFMNEFFPQYTEAYINARKAEEKAKKAQEKKELEALKKLSPEKQILAKLERLKKLNEK